MIEAYLIDPYLSTVSSVFIEGDSSEHLDALKIHLGYESIDFLFLNDALSGQHSLTVEEKANIVVFEDGNMSKCNQLFKLGPSICGGKALVIGCNKLLYGEESSIFTPDVTMEEVESWVTWIG